MQSLKNAINIWEKNENNPEEEFWQKSLTEHSFVLEQVFSWPTSIVDGKAYIGGKNVFNKSGNIVDFLLKNRMTQSAALVEIKTPMSALLGSKYRGTFNVSPELSGSIMQTLNYKHSLQEDFQSLTRGGGDLFDSLNPQCAVIIGNAHRELDHQTKIKAFELFRHQFPGLTVFTFDELFDKTRHLIKLLGPVNTN
ncbi:MAG: Shedu anti-phage system protein SduA domain-containing protein [Candidatus Thiodiazotropha sp.]